MQKQLYGEEESRRERIKDLRRGKKENEMERNTATTDREILDDDVTSRQMETKRNRERVRLE